MLGGVVTFFISSINLTTTVYTLEVYLSTVKVNLLRLFLYF